MAAASATTTLPGERGVPSESLPRAAARCPACEGREFRIFHEQRGVPVDSFGLADTREGAMAAPRGDLRLAACGSCGMIWNAAVDPSLQDYSAVFDETQWFSPRFQAFCRGLVRRLVESHGLWGKQFLEIGCGPGHFLGLLCRESGGRGVGLDPCYTEKAGLDGADLRDVRIVAEYLSEQHAPLIGDLVVCRHTLEHVQEVGDLVHLLRRCIGERHDTVVFFEVPDMWRILREAAFWQIYYEHCSYPTAGATARLFRRADFEVLDLRLDYDDQYVLIEAKPDDGTARGVPAGAEEPVEEVLGAVDRFAAIFEANAARWRRVVGDAHRSGRRVVLWGGAPQSVAFTLALGLQDEIDTIVNINPVQQGRFALGTGQRVVAPEALRALRPDLVIAMNAIYRDEIGRSLEELGVSADLMVV